MEFWSDSFGNMEKIPAEFAFGKYHPQTHVELCPNQNPHFAWSALPTGCKSLVLICRDTDVPSRADNVNKEHITVPTSLPRVDFFHWVLVDLPPDPAQIEAGEFSNGIVPRGKPGPLGPRDTRQGLNNFTQWFAGDKNLKGNYFGYDGPCPPWNDELVHHYHFTLYALGVEKCPVDGQFSGPDVLNAIQPHVLRKATITGLYHIYPDARLED
ncbi:MAG: YbhB/YbcL family Raf kinase inhibitor-like protein [Bdellovibrionota bacterium]